MRLLFMYPPSPYLNHSMFKHYTYFAETIHLVSKWYPQLTVMDCAVEMKSRNEIYDAFRVNDILVLLVEPYNIHTALSLAEIFKDIQPKGKTILYGTAAVLVANFLSQYKQVDNVIANGNFVDGIVNITRCIENGQKSNAIIQYPQGDPAERTWGCSLDAPVPLDRYRYFGSKMFEFTVQVGCPYQCSFCSEKLLFPKSSKLLYAQRPVNEIVSIMERVKGHFDSVYFSATTLTYDRDWIIAICEELTKRNCIIPWRSDTRVDCLDPELLQIMKKSGLKSLSLGVESFEDHLLQSVNKRQSAKTVLDQIVMCQENGVDVKALLILGLPGQTAEDVLHTQHMVEKLGISYRWKEYSPIRELYLADRKGDDIALFIDSFSRSSYRANSIPGLTAQQYMSLLFPHGYVR